MWPGVGPAPQQGFSELSDGANDADVLPVVERGPEEAESGCIMSQVGIPGHSGHFQISVTKGEHATPPQFRCLLEGGCRSVCRDKTPCFPGRPWTRARIYHDGPCRIVSDVRGTPSPLPLAGRVVAEFHGSPARMAAYKRAIRAHHVSDHLLCSHGNTFPLSRSRENSVPNGRLLLGELAPADASTAINTPRASPLRPATSLPRRGPRREGLRTASRPGPEPGASSLHSPQGAP